MAQSVDKTFQVKVTYDELNFDRKDDVSLEDFKTIMRAELRSFDKLDGNEDGVITNGGSVLERNGLAGGSGDGLWMFNQKAVKAHGLPSADDLGVVKKGLTIAGEDSRYFNIDDYLTKLFVKLTDSNPVLGNGFKYNEFKRSDAQAHVAEKNFNTTNKNFWLKMF